MKTKIKNIIRKTLDGAIIGFVFLLAATIAGSINTARYINNLSKDLKWLHDNEIIGKDLIQDSRFHMHVLDKEIKNLLLSKTDAATGGAARGIKSSISLLMKSLNQAKPLFYTKDGKTFMYQALTSAQLLVGHSEKIIDCFHRNSIDEATALAFNEFRTESLRLDSTLVNLESIKNKTDIALYRRIISSQRSTLTFLIIVLIATVAGRIGMFIFDRNRRRPGLFKITNLYKKNPFSKPNIKYDKIAVFDMDNTVTHGRFIFAAADTFAFRGELIKILEEHEDPKTRTDLIAMLLKGKSIDSIISVSNAIPIVSDVSDVAAKLKKMGYITGIITNSYDVVAENVTKKTGMDFHIGYGLKFSKGICTGKVIIPSCYNRSDKSICEHKQCKSNVLMHLSELHGVPMQNIMAVGDGENDICMIKAAGIGVAFCSENAELISAAHKVISKRSFKKLLKFVR